MLKEGFGKVSLGAVMWWVGDYNYSHRPLGCFVDRKNLTWPRREEGPAVLWLVGTGEGKERSVLRDAKITLQFNKALQFRSTPTPTPNTARYRTSSKTREGRPSTAPAFLSLSHSRRPTIRPSKNTDSSKTIPSLRNPLSPSHHTHYHITYFYLFARHLRFLLRRLRDFSTTALVLTKERLFCFYTPQLVFPF